MSSFIICISIYFLLMFHFAIIISPVLLPKYILMTNNILKLRTSKCANINRDLRSWTVFVQSSGYERTQKKIEMRSHIKPGGLWNKNIRSAFAIYLCMAVGKKSERVWPRPVQTQRDLTCSQKANSEMYCSLFRRWPTRCDPSLLQHLWRLQTYCQSEFSLFHYYLPTNVR